MVIYLDCLGIELQPLLLIYKKFLDIFSLISLELYYLSHFSIINYGAIAR